MSQNNFVSDIISVCTVFKGQTLAFHLSEIVLAINKFYSSCFCLTWIVFVRTIRLPAYVLQQSNVLKIDNKSTVLIWLHCNKTLSAWTELFTNWHSLALFWLATNAVITLKVIYVFAWDWSLHWELLPFRKYFACIDILHRYT